jgi:DNA-directed RNA polymerase subunit H (RpoH/RPB5)
MPKAYIHVRVPLNDIEWNRLGTIASMLQCHTPYETELHPVTSPNYETFGELTIVSELEHAQALKELGIEIQELWKLFTNQDIVQVSKVYDTSTNKELPQP